MERSPRIVVTMIVKNEAHVIERCLRSLRPVMDAYCIVDTGSIDGTQDVIKKAMAQAGIPGNVYNIPWRDFAYNRSRALDLAKHWGDYAFMIDADEEAFFVEGFDANAWKASLSADVYHILFRNGALYVRPQITATSKSFSYRGRLHEFLEPPPGASFGGTIQSFHVVSKPDGARSQNPNKYEDDARVLEAALARNTEPDLRSRYVYYCAQSHRDCGNYEAAIGRYLERAAMGGWTEEVFSSLLWAARLGHMTGRPKLESIGLFLRASDAATGRAEALVGGAALAREDHRWSTAFMLASRAASLVPYDNALFLELDSYEWRAKYELSIAAWYVGQHQLGHDVSLELLSEDRLPAPERTAVENNLALYRQALTK